jgi:hypothetical protein
MKQIRQSKFTKILAYYLMIMMCLQVAQPMQVYALTTGPSQPEFNSFTPIGTSDMVDLASGDFNYNIPIMDVGGYPLNLAYNSGVTMDQEASWVGLGWDLSVGQIARQVRGLPDDFNGDQMIYENNMKPNITIGSNFNFFVAPFGTLEDLKISVGLGIKYNNYNGFGFSTNGGLTYSLNESVKVGMNLESSSTEGVSVSPSVSFSQKLGSAMGQNFNLGASLGVSLNSRKGLESLSLSSSVGVESNKFNGFDAEGYATTSDKPTASSYGVTSGSLSFVDASFTPAKRVGMSSSNYMASFNIETAIWGIDPGTKLSGFRTTQGIKESEKYKIERGFGYENTHNAISTDILDFNREKDRSINKNTVSLPVTNYTYDIYNVQGQGVGGMFRPYRGQVGYVFDNYTRDDSNGGSLGVELGGGSGVHFGVDLTETTSNSSTGVWTSGNQALNRMKEKNTGNAPNYEKVLFKNVGGFHVDKDMKTVFDNENGTAKLGGYGPISFRVNEGSKFSRTTSYSYYDKFLSNQLSVGNEPYIKRGEHRLNRNQTIQKLNILEAFNYGSRTLSPFANKKTQKHHTAEIRILKDDGMRYNYGRAAYNVIKKEVTFDVGTTPNVDCKNGLVTYQPGVDNSPNNKQSGDRYFNRITTPGYAHSYLLSSVLSSDYQDIDGLRGPSDGDLGTYTKFSYISKSKDENGKKSPYKWRTPYQENQANYDGGLRSLNNDDKGNYVYGEKEMLYINKIETKTHIAIFTISARKDGHGVKGENGGLDLGQTSKMWKLEKISLYSKPEYLANPEAATPIKVAHFVYDYSLCKGVLNNSNQAATAPSEINNQGGKLTLKKIYFTYRNSNMGKYAPYEFNYDELNPLSNPLYDQKAYDSWGCYKPSNKNVGCGTEEGLSNTEYPYVDQSDKAKADEYSSSWLLRSIDLPSGGKMELQYESDEYQFVQSKEVMQMFKVVGAGASVDPKSFEINYDPSKNDQKQLYDNIFGVNDYLYIKLDKRCDSNEEFKKKYIDRLKGESVYFRFLLNMTNPNVENNDKYDYVTGYLDLANDFKIFGPNNQYAAVKIKKVSKGDVLSDFSSDVNPISKAGWYFGRQYLNDVVYSLTGNRDVNNIKGVLLSLINLIPQIASIFKNANTQLQEKFIAQRFITNKSWIRLMQPDAKKIGGGCRVKEIKIKDEWDVMTNHKNEEVYKQFYGQQYSYNLENEDGSISSSGVAAYEPLGSKENPFVYPFYDKTHREVLLGPDSQNYVELPFGESFFPSPKITYSRVSVRNLPREKTDASGNIITVKKHATGRVVSEFFTTRDYPTLTDISLIDPKYDDSPLGSLLGINVKTYLTMSQGFSIHTNDMDGKMKSQWVYAEDQTKPISGMEYKYEQQASNNDPMKGKLNNKVVTIDEAGKIEDNIIGVDYDVINDFSENYSETVTKGVNTNVETLFFGVFIVVVPIPIPSFSKHRNILRKAVTTKVIHTTGLLREKIAYDAGSNVSTKNLAWDANTGEVLITETVNEYNDNYFSFNFPGYWANKGMSQAALNIGLEASIENIPGKKYKLSGSYSASSYLIDGDELWITSTKTVPIDKKGFKAWVVNVNGNTFDLIDENGIKIDGEPNKDEEVKVLKQGDIKVIRSGHRNMQMASMASVTSMKNPLYEYDVNNKITTIKKSSIGIEPFLSTSWDQNRIVNASAIEYKDAWPSQCDCGLPKMLYTDKGELKFEYDQNSNEDYDLIAARSYNPYKYNILGNWRPVKSYAYLTGRNNTSDPTPRKTGFFMNYAPFYVYNSSEKKWNKTKGDDLLKWTFASEVTKHNPYGQEVENKDALLRYSTALYGYNKRFPLAVSSNSKYSETAYDGFEDYDFSDCDKTTHFSYEEAILKDKVSITGKQAHTGRKSIRIEPLSKAMVTKKVINCDNVITPVEPVPLNKTKPSVKKPTKNKP